MLVKQMLKALVGNIWSFSWENVNISLSATHRQIWHEYDRI